MVGGNVAGFRALCFCRNVYYSFDRLPMVLSRSELLFLCNEGTVRVSLEAQRRVGLMLLQHYLFCIFFYAYTSFLLGSVSPTFMPLEQADECRAAWETESARARLHS